MASLVAQEVKNLCTMQETRVQSLGQEDPLQKGIATHSSILAWRIPWTGAWWATVDGVRKSQTRLSDFHSFSIFLDGNFHVCKMEIISSCYLGLYAR